MRVQLETRSLSFVLESQPLGQGGEAAVYVVPDQRDLPPLVAKIYHKPSARHAEKLAAMIANPPVDPMADKGHASIAWPLDCALSADRQRAFLGFVMPRVKRALPIFEFYNPKSRLQYCPLFHFGYLLQAARNLCAAVRAVHERGYVVGDLNESNVLVNNQALVTLVDTDSFQVPAHGKTFRCPVGKPEYTAPELQGVNFPDVDRSTEHDTFGLAVILFQMLMQGVHPFAGRYIGPGEPASLSERISAGQWPYGQGGRIPYQPNPHAPPWSILPLPLQERFQLCFGEGHRHPRCRPDAANWQEALDQAVHDLATCEANDQHVFSPAAGDCPWCLLARRQGRDPFPSKKVVEAGLAGVRPRTPKPKQAPTAPASGVPVLVTAALLNQSSHPILAPAASRRPRHESAEESVWTGFTKQLLVIVGLLLALYLFFSKSPQDPAGSNRTISEPNPDGTNSKVIHVRPENATKRR